MVPRALWGLVLRGTGERALLSQDRHRRGKGYAGVRQWRCGHRRRGGRGRDARCSVASVELHPRRAGRSLVRCGLRFAIRLGDGVRRYANEGATAESGRRWVGCCGWCYGQNYCDRPAHRCSDSPRIWRYTRIIGPRRASIKTHGRNACDCSHIAVRRSCRVVLCPGCRREGAREFYSSKSRYEALT